MKSLQGQNPLLYQSYLDLGESYYFRRPVSEALFSRLPATALLALSIMLVSCLLGIPLGVITALRHILRNALLPVITIMCIDIAGLLTGIVLVENVFSWPEIGMQTLQAAQKLDVPMTWLDPRVQLEG
jgi:ABC-type dipeptide/oligopeptide/nickel transport system permease component